MREIHPSVMARELQEYLATAEWEQAAVRAVAELLPREDGELDRLIAGIVEAKDLQGFIFVVCGALGAGRRVDARHLHHGAMLIPSEHLLVSMAWHMEGDVAGNLVAAVRDTLMTPKNAAAGLFVAAAWGREHQQGVWPPELIPLARRAARAKKPEGAVVYLIHSIALIVGDAGLSALLEGWERKPDPDTVRNFREAMMVFCRAEVMTMVPEAQPKVLARGGTMRRSVARHGRNEPCPCGSGRKYKKCCAEKDDARLHQSSGVAGLTRQEVEADPERHLTALRLQGTPPHDLARFDAALVPAALQADFLLRVAEFALVEEAVVALEKLGYREEFKEAWRASAYYVAQADRRDLLERLLALRTDREAALKDEVGLGCHLLLAGDDAAAVYQALEGCAMEALRSEDAETLKHFAFGLLACRMRPLGIFAARSVIPLLPKQEASSIFEWLLKARDKLNLPPDDAFEEILEKRLLEREDGDGSDEEALLKAQQKLEGKAREVRELKESLAQAHKELQRHEKAASAPAAPAPAVPAAPAPAVEERALKELRGKVEKFREALKERHEERNDLRRELQQAHVDLEALRESAPPPGEAGREEAEQEEGLLLPEEDAGAQPVRTIEFPKGFQEKLASLPRSVARGTMTMLGRLAAGEPAAFVGAVRLKACPVVMRVRMGSDFRLLFRLLPDRVQVVDLIPRQDLERRIKTLVKSAAGG